jgi:hypothetical protein
MSGQLPPAALQRLRPRFTSAQEFQAALNFAEQTLKTNSAQGVSPPDTANAIPSDLTAPNPNVQHITPENVSSVSRVSNPALQAKEDFLKAALAQAKGFSQPRTLTTAPGSTTPNPGGSLADATASLAQALAGKNPKLAVPNVSIMDPISYARSAVNQQYNPQINGLLGALTAAKHGTATTQKDISKWFAGVEQLYNQAARDEAAFSTNQQSSLGDTLSGLVGTLGPSAGKSVAALSSDLTAEQAGLSKNQHNLFERMRPIIGLQAAEQHVNQADQGEQLAAAIQNSIRGVRGAKGDAYPKALYDALDQQNQQKIAQFNAGATAALLPSQLQTSILGNTATAQGIVQNEAMAPIAIQKAKNEASGTMNLTNASQRGQLVAALQKGMGFGPNSTLRIGPNKAWQNALNVLTYAGVADNPEALSLAKTALQMGLRNSHARHKWTQFKIGPNGLPVHA